MHDDASQTRHRLFGSIGSPYALKLRSLMRYKRLPFDWVPATLDWIPSDLSHPPLCAAGNAAIADLNPKVVPAIYFPADKSVRNESTTLAYALDQVHPDRPVIPADPGVAFLSHLLEDMADEWLVKIAFLYRWGNADDAAHKSRIVSGEFLGGGYDQSILVDAASHFARRQQSRMPLVGCTPENAAMIIASFRQLLNAMDRLMTRTTFIFGASPTLADFGFYGQLQSLATDPTSWTVMRELSPGAFPYLQLLEDSSGIEPAVSGTIEPGEPTLDLLRVAALFYLPYLEANERAVANGHTAVSFQALGLDYRQAPFKYHAKCYRILRDEFTALPADAWAWTRDVLARTGALAYFEGDATRRSA